MTTPKRSFIITLLVFLSASFTGMAQEVSLYKVPVKFAMPSAALKDTETVELILPKEFDMSEGGRYPVLFVFDKQNQFIYKNSIQTIDYLTAMMQMPPCIIVGITYNGSNRGRRTLPDYRSKNGQADETLSFLLDELFPALVKDYKAADFKLFIGHSRTAIFSGYAVSKRPKDINGIIASSTSYFDFGQKEEKELFDKSIDTIARLKRNCFYFFSAGDSLAGDEGHVSSVIMLDRYFQDKKFPPNFIWKSYFHKGASHNTTPGLTVPQALNTIFDRYTETLARLFKKPFTADTSSLFSLIDKEYADVSAWYGYAVQPGIVLYNSIASHYQNVGNELGDKRFAMAKAIWEKGLAAYPHYEGFYTAIAELYLRENNMDQYRDYLLKASTAVDKSLYANESGRTETRKDILQKLAQLKK